MSISERSSALYHRKSHKFTGPIFSQLIKKNRIMVNPVSHYSTEANWKHGIIIKIATINRQTYDPQQHLHGPGKYVKIRYNDDIKQSCQYIWIHRDEFIRLWQDGQITLYKHNMHKSQTPAKSDRDAIDNRLKEIYKARVCKMKERYIRRDMHEKHELRKLKDKTFMDMRWKRIYQTLEREHMCRFDQSQWWYNLRFWRTYVEDAVDEIVKELKRNERNKTRVELVFGFVRLEIEPLLSDNMIVPLEVPGIVHQYLK